MTTTTSLIGYYERITCSAQWLDFTRALAAELSAGLPPEENRRLFFRIGERVAHGLPVARCGTLVELQAAINARWESIDWGFATLEESADRLSIVHACSPIAMAFGPDTTDWAAGFFEGAYQAWFQAQGSPAELRVRADAAPAADGLPVVGLTLGRPSA
ncbi:cellulose biosynthesis protein BcsD [Variovorax boronicumulans]|uniref:cellulose biosynthesis protein BcsD n=1 Tax=Variovorax boronicumulans TaxID=436515 RepID=UPI001C57EE2C